MWLLRKFKKATPFALAVLWLVYFGLGFGLHYHPEYVHAHDSEMNPHEHGGHFHSQEIDRIAEVFHVAHAHEADASTHHHSESAPGSDPESAQYDFNKNSVPPVKFKDPLQVVFVQPYHPEPEPIRYRPVSLDVPLEKIQHQFHFTPERSPPTLSI